MKNLRRAFGKKYNYCRCILWIIIERNAPADVSAVVVAKLHLLEIHATLQVWLPLPQAVTEVISQLISNFPDQYTFEYWLKLMTWKTIKLLTEFYLFFNRLQKIFQQASY